MGKGVFLCLVSFTVPFSTIHHDRKQLEALQLYDDSRKIATVPADLALPDLPNRGRAAHKALPVLPHAPQFKSQLPHALLWSKMALPPSAKSAAAEATPQHRLLLALQRLRPDVSAEELQTHMPHKWEEHGDLIVLPEQALAEPAWQRIDPNILWPAVAEALGCKRLARRGRVQADGQRHSGTVLLWGEDGWVRRVENAIIYTWDVTRCMFSRGNISEKQRVANFQCENEVVCDLYAGIGYFVLPYLVHARARRVIACEWNPEAVVALRRNLELNGVRSAGMVLLLETPLAPPAARYLTAARCWGATMQRRRPLALRIG